MKFKKIKKITLDEPVDVYNLTVDNQNHNFPIFINGELCFVKNCDEINEKGVDEALALLNTLDNRFASRFQGSDLVFQSVVSSARTTNSPIGEYVRRLPKEPSLMEIAPCLWEVKPDPNFVGDGTTFPVLVGNGSIPSKIITDPGELKAIEEKAFVEPRGCTLIHVPTVYKSKFELQLDQSIQDIAGMTTSDNNSVFRDTTQLEDSSLTPELQLEANLKDNTDLLACLPENVFAKDFEGHLKFKRAPKALRYCHLDLSGGGNDGQCDSGVCILHKEYKINKFTNEKETIFVVDLLLAINAKNKIDLQAIQNLMINMSIDKGANIHTISADQYQCLTGDTLIDLLDGRKLTIKEIVENFDKNDYYTYTYDTTNKKIVPGKVIGGLKTGHKQVYKVTLDNGEEIKCTEDHPFLLRDCTYKKAKDLTPNDSLMALYKDVTKKGYELTYNPVSKSWKETYKRILEWLAKKRINHKIVSIEKLGFEDVYDIQIDNFPNFALSSGVFVHNSLIMLQSFETSGCFSKVEKVSVDTKPEPYLNASRLIESGKVKIGICPKARKELESLVWLKGKVVRTTELKDLADALVGAIFNAQLNYSDDPTYEYIDALEDAKPVQMEDLIDIDKEYISDLF